MQESFYGREDEDLTAKLLAERPGILNLAIEALDALRARGKLIQPETGIEMSERLGDLTSDVIAVRSPSQQNLPALAKLVLATQHSARLGR
jgi:hypothetical protein